MLDSSSKLSTFGSLSRSPIVPSMSGAQSFSSSKEEQRLPTTTTISATSSSSSSSCGGSVPPAYNSSFHTLFAHPTITADMAKALNINTQDTSRARGSNLADLLSPAAMRNTGSERPVFHKNSSIMSLPSVRSLSAVHHPSSPILASRSSSSSFPSTPTSASTINSDSSDSTNDAWLLQGQTKRTEKLMRQAFTDIHDTCNTLNLDQKIVEAAKQIYWAAKSQSLCRGKSNESLAGASVYFSCRQENQPRTFHEIASASRSNKRDIGRCYKAMEKYLKTKGMSKMTTDDMITRICTQLVFENVEDLSWIQERACMVARLADENNLIASKSPLSVAAASVFMVILVTNPGRQRVTKDMAKASGVSEVTLRNIYREFYSSRHQIMPTCTIITPASVESMPSLQHNVS